jgi:hypothetical protein
MGKIVEYKATENQCTFGVPTSRWSVVLAHHNPEL